MSLAHRVIPTILCRGRALVKGKQFNAWRTVGVASQAVRIHQARGVDELILLDITATPEGRGPNLDLVRELAEVCFMPLSVGGGVRSVEDVRALLQAGADKVVIRSAGVALMEKAAPIVGCQALIAALDVNGLGHKPPGFDYVAAARRWADAGAGEIMVTRMEREGMMCGYDLELIHDVSAAVDIPVIANGGCGSYDDMAKAIEAGASAVAAGAFFQFTESTPKEAATFLQSRGIEARV